MSITTNTVEIRTFSLSLAVKDLEVSRDFYAKLGFRIVAGAVEHRMLIMKNGNATIGLFQGMFERNTLTFNPGWDADCTTLPRFTDVRDLQRHLRHEGIEPAKPVDESTTGPGSLLLVDPDGNPVLIDQHV